MKKYLIALAIPAVLWVSCKGGDPNEDYTQAADCSTIVDSVNTYAKTIKTIVDDQCAGCHGGSNPSDGLKMDTYATTKAAFESSGALCTIHHGNGCKPMPDNSPKLADSLIRKIDCWVKNGYKQ